MPKKRFISGVVDPITLIGVLFLIITLSVGTYVVTNKDSKLNLGSRAKAILEGDDFNYLRGNRAELDKQIKERKAEKATEEEKAEKSEPAPVTTTTTTPKTCDIDGVQHPLGEVVVYGGIGSYATCGNDGWQVGVGSLADVENVPEYIKPIEAQIEQNEAADLQKVAAELEKEELSISGNTNPNTGMTTVTQEEFDSIKKGCELEGGVWSDGICKNDEYHQQQTANFIEQQSQAVNNSTGQSPYVSLSDTLRNIEVQKNTTVTIPSYVTGAIPSSQQNLSTNNIDYTSCANGGVTPEQKEICRDIARVTAYNSPIVGDYIKSYLPQNVQYTGNQFLGYNLYDPTKEQFTSSVSLGTTITAALALPYAAGAYVAGGVTGTQAISLAMATSTMYQSGNAVDICVTLGEDAPECKVAKRWAAISWLNVGSSGIANALQASRFATAANIANGIVNIENIAFDFEDISQSCGDGEHASSFGCVMAYGGLVFDAGQGVFDAARGINSAISNRPGTLVSSTEADTALARIFDQPTTTTQIHTNTVDVTPDALGNFRVVDDPNRIAGLLPGGTVQENIPWNRFQALTTSQDVTDPFRTMYPPDTRFVNIDELTLMTDLESISRPTQMLFEPSLRSEAEIADIITQPQRFPSNPTPDEFRSIDISNPSGTNPLRIEDSQNVFRIENITRPVADWIAENVTRPIVPLVDRFIHGVDPNGPATTTIVRNEPSMLFVPRENPVTNQGYLADLGNRVLDNVNESFSNFWQNNVYSWTDGFLPNWTNVGTNPVTNLVFGNPNNILADLPTTPLTTRIGDLASQINIDDLIYEVSDGSGIILSGKVSEYDNIFRANIKNQPYFLGAEESIAAANAYSDGNIIIHKKITDSGNTEVTIFEINGKKYAIKEPYLVGTYGEAGRSVQQNRTSAGEITFFESYSHKDDDIKINLANTTHLINPDTGNVVSIQRFIEGRIPNDLEIQSIDRALFNSNITLEDIYVHRNFIIDNNGEAWLIDPEGILELKGEIRENYFLRLLYGDNYPLVFKRDPNEFDIFAEYKDRKLQDNIKPSDQFIQQSDGTKKDGVIVGNNNKDRYSFSKNADFALSAEGEISFIKRDGSEIPLQIGLKNTETNSTVFQDKAGNYYSLADGSKTVVVKLNRNSNFVSNLDEMVKRLFVYTPKQNINQSIEQISNATSQLTKSELAKILIDGGYNPKDIDIDELVFEAYRNDLYLVGDSHAIPPKYQDIELQTNWFQRNVYSPTDGFLPAIRDLWDRNVGVLNFNGLTSDQIAPPTTNTNNILDDIIASFNGIRQPRLTNQEIPNITRLTPDENIAVPAGLLDGNIDRANPQFTETDSTISQDLPPRKVTNTAVKDLINTSLPPAIKAARHISPVLPIVGLLSLGLADYVSEEVFNIDLIDFSTNTQTISVGTELSGILPPVLDSANEINQNYQIQEANYKPELQNQSPTVPEIDIFKPNIIKNSDGTIHFTENYVELPHTAYSESLIEPTKIIIHWDGNANYDDPTKWTTSATYNGLVSRDTSSHFAVGIDGVAQFVPMTEDKVAKTWAYTGDPYVINIEFCGAHFDKVPPSDYEVQEGIKLIASLIVQYDLDIEDIVGHRNNEPNPEFVIMLQSEVNKLINTNYSK